jgi:hypothetical protein
MMQYVVIVTDADGSESVLGTPSGRAFTSRDNALILAESILDDSTNARVLPIERCDSPWP